MMFVSCDDNTATLGVDMMPASDLVAKNYQVYDVTTESYAVGDSVLARTNMSYLGRFTDPETNTTIKSDFLAQFHCEEGFSIPDAVLNDSCTRFDLRLFINDFIGDWYWQAYNEECAKMWKENDPDIKNLFIRKVTSERVEKFLSDNNSTVRFIPIKTN